MATKVGIFTFQNSSEWFKTWWMHQLGLYKNSLYFESKNIMIKDLKFELLIVFNSPITEHWTLLHYTRHLIIIKFFYIEFNNFCDFGSASWRRATKCSLSFQSRRKMKVIIWHQTHKLGMKVIQNEITGIQT
jgi:hypothetical protein